jgi:hypothetical protein
MQFASRKTGLLILLGALVLCCSCEKHQLGEIPPAQKEHVDIGSGTSEDSDVVKERSISSPAPSAKPTPAEFFPEATPR